MKINVKNNHVCLLAGYLMFIAIVLLLAVAEKITERYVKVVKVCTLLLDISFIVHLRMLRNHFIVHLATCFAKSVASRVKML